MMALNTIKRQEYVAQVRHISNLYDKLPRDPVTEFEFELHRTILWDIERAEKILLVMED